MSSLRNKKILKNIKQWNLDEKGEEACTNGYSSESGVLKGRQGEGRRWVGKLGVGVGTMVVGDTREASKRK